MRKRLCFEYTEGEIVFGEYVDKSIEVKGKNRDLLIKKLIEKKNAKALYYFLEYFPELSEEHKENIRQQILDIEQVSSLEEFKKKVFIYHEPFTHYTSLLILSENLDRCILR